MPFSSVGRWQWALFAGAFAGCFLSWASYRAYRDAEGWADHTAAVRREVARLSRDCLRAETGQRGYLLTGRDEYLDAYRRGTADAPARLARLRDLTRDNPAQRDRLAAVAAEVDAKFAELADTVRKVSEGDKPGAYTVVQSDRGKRSQDRIDAGLDAVAAEEDRLLVDRAGRAEWLFRACLTCSVLAGVGVGAAGLVAWRAYRR